MNQPNIFLVKTTKSILNDIFRICALQSLSKEGEEHGEVDGTRRFTHHPFQILLSWILSKRSKHVMEIFVVNETIPVMINHVERLLELLDLVLVEHSKHIAGGSLSSFLRCSLTSCSFS